MADDRDTLLVTGASGGLGQLVIANLIEVEGVDPHRIIAVTRSPERLADIAARGVTVRHGDFDDPEGLESAFRGADRLLLISVGADPLESYLADQDPMGDPNRKRVLRQIAAVHAAARAGVGHILYTSAPNPEPPTMCFWKRDHWRTEEAIRASGMDWSMLRMWEYPDFHLTYSWAQSLGSGTFLCGSGAGRCSFIAREDCARAAAAALAGKGQSGRIYDITGREALTLDQVMALLSQANGRPIRVDHVSPEELRRRLEQQGEEIGPVYAAFQEGILHGKYDRESGDFQELTGKLPDTLAHFFEHNRVTDEQMQVKYRYADHPE